MVGQGFAKRHDVVLGCPATSTIASRSLGAPMA
jgi:hypothetical protein